MQSKALPWGKMAFLPSYGFAHLSHMHGGFHLLLLGTWSCLCLHGLPHFALRNDDYLKEHLWDIFLQVRPQGQTARAV